MLITRDSAGSPRQAALRKKRRYLLKYFGLDPYAMVKVWKELCEVAAR